MFGLLTHAQTTAALRDIAAGGRGWRIWWLLGIGDIRQRYARSRLGQFWITISMGVFVGALGIVYAILFQQPMQDYLPFLAINMVVWGLISGMITDGATTFTQAESFLRQEAMPKTVFLMRVIVRNLLTFAHNLVIFPIVFIGFGHAPSVTWLLALPGLLLATLAGFFAAMLVGVLCTRFRDLPQIIQSVVQIGFFVTPVMWPAESLRGQLLGVIHFNPFAALLHIVAEPMRGIVPDAATYGTALATTAVLGLVGFAFFARFRARIVYWL